MSVAVVVDGGASLPEGTGVVTIPLQLDEVPDRSGERATAAPSPGAFLEAIEEADAGDGVVVITVATRFSASSAAATLAARLARSQGRRVEVVDSTTATVGEGLVALEALRVASAGADLDSVVASARRVATSVCLVAAIGRLDELVRSGRVPAIAASASRLVGLRPLFELRASAIRPLRPTVGLDRAEGRVTERFARAIPLGHVAHIGVLHGEEPESAARLLAAATAATEVASSFVAELSSLMLLHTGPSVVGLAWWSEPDRGDWTR